MDRQCRRNRRKREQAQMGIVIKTYTAKPTQVEAVQITDANMEEVAKWCGGEVRTDKPSRYIKAKVYRALNEKQTMGYVSDWVLKRGNSFKVYTDKAFKNGYTDGELIPMVTNSEVVLPASIFEGMVDALSTPKTTTIRVGANEAAYFTPAKGVPFIEPKGPQLQNTPWVDQYASVALNNPAEPAPLTGFERPLSE